MNLKRVISCILTLIIIIIAGCSSSKNDPDPVPENIAELVDYINENHQTPEDYVISSFENADIVILGEYHRIKHDAVLVQNLIPKLYENGIYNLGIEFANYGDQGLIDSLLSANEYNEEMAREIQFRQWPFWGFQEYVDIYKSAWELNKSLPKDAPKFRIVGLNAASNWSQIWTVEDRSNREKMKTVWANGDGDQVMAQSIITEFIDKNEKALIYCGINHGYTRYHQPNYNVELDTLYQLNNQRMGNIVFKKIGTKSKLIFLHAPWPPKENNGQYVLTADGAIDALISELEPSMQRAGFDVVGTPFASLSGSTSYWQYGYPDFKLADYCDGYIIQKPLSEYEGCGVIEDFINESNRLDAIAQSANPATKDSSNTVKGMMDGMKRDTDFKQRFRNLTID